MTLDIKVKTSNSCKVTIKDVSSYQDEDSTSVCPGVFKYSETISIDVLRLNKVNDEDVTVTEKYTDHTGNKIVNIPVTFDGVFEVIHIVLPTLEWLENQSESVLKESYTSIYYCDGETIYLYCNDGTTPVKTIEDIIEASSNDDTTISIISKQYVSVCYLNKCYIDLCLQIFNSRAFSACWNNNNIDNELTYKRDLVWMALNVIKYLTECEQLAEVARILELLEGCNGLCSSTSSTSKVSSCGCSK